MNIKYKDHSNFICPSCGKDDFNPCGGCAICVGCRALISNQYMGITAEEKNEPVEEKKEKIEEKKENK